MKSRFAIWSKVLAVLLLLGFTACGKQTFDKQQFSAKVNANQYITIKPKVDIILFQDISGSMVQPSEQMRAQMASFASSINNNWDFHFAILPLQRVDDLRGRWILASNCAGVMNCTTSASGYASGAYGFYSADPNYGNVDDGFANMQANLSNNASMAGSGFLRPDAMLVIIPFTNGNDITGMSFPTDYKDRGDGQMIPNYSSANAIASFNSFKNYLTNTLKPSISLVSFYSVVAGNPGQSPDFVINPCQGGSAWPGSRYIDMALQIDAAYPGFANGGNYNICAGQLSSTLASIATRMQDLVLAVEFNFIVLPERPVPGSLKIYKNGSLLAANDAVNGWTLYNVVNGVQQYTTNKNTSYAPSPGNAQSGYFIELHGSARFKGTDQITYTYEKF